MPKRFTGAQLDAALAVGEPPRSESVVDDQLWHAAQDQWLARWQPGLILPGGTIGFGSTIVIVFHFDQPCGLGLR